MKKVDPIDRMIRGMYQRQAKASTCPACGSIDVAMASSATDFDDGGYGWPTDCRACGWTRKAGAR